jgi:putative flippase GtrA
LKSNLQFFRFVSVGAFGTALHYAVLVFFVSLLNCDPAVGAMAGAACGAAFNYLLNRCFTFRSDRPHTEALPRFVLLAGIGVLLNGVIVKGLTMVTVNYLASQVAATLTIFILNFFLSKLWIFRQSQ